MRRRIHPPQTQSRQPVDFRKRARHHNIVARRHKLDAAFIIIGAHIFTIGRVDHQQDVGTQTGLQALHLVNRQIAARRVVRVGHKHDFCFRRHGGQDRVHIRPQIAFLHLDKLCACRRRHNGINQKPMLGRNRFVAVTEISLRQQMQKLVRTRTANKPICIQAVTFTNRLAQLFR